jgi:vitellogenic carboxypeptidase-like protein/serine carboxypeptidase-like clade 4
MNLIEKSDYERINRFIPPCEFAIKMCGEYLYYKETFVNIARFYFLAIVIKSGYAHYFPVA